MASNRAATRWAYFNGEWTDDRALSVPVDDPGFVMGVTAVERLRTFGGEAFRQAQHLERMRRSCEIIGLAAEPIVAEIDNAIGAFLERNRSLLADGDDWAIVAFATPGAADGPTRCVHGFPLPFGAWAHQYKEGASLHVSDHRQTPAGCWPTELKCRSRMHYYLADRQAEQIEPGARALLLDQDGFVGEASIANVVICNESEGVVSPRLEKVLPGVSVTVVRELAESLGIAFAERDLTVEEFLAADEAWLTGTSACLLPVVRCNHQPIGGGRPGPVCRRVLTAWGEMVGVDIAGQAERSLVGGR